MLRNLAAATNRTFTQQQLYQKLLYSLGGQNVITARLASSSNPQNLPALPVPELKNTVEKYLKSVKPFLDEKEFANTTKLFKKFSDPNGVGLRLQSFLIDKAKNSTNWLEQWWVEAAYLGFRQPVVIFSSPGQTIPIPKYNSEGERLISAAKLILAAASYKMLIDSKKIPVDKMGKAELDMNQYNKIFGTCRIPDVPVDSIEFNQTSKHVVVVHNHEYFKINVFNNKGQPLSERQLVGQLNQVLLHSPKCVPPVGILSSEHRDKWGIMYKMLIKDPRNKESVREIQKSLFLVALDHLMIHKPNDNVRTASGRQLIHGGGSANAGNRWFDKTVQFIFGTDGIVGLTYEHSPSEGQPVAVMVDYLYKFITKDGGKNIPDGDHDQEPVKLYFNVNDDLKVAIETAKKDINKLVDNFELNCFSYKTFGKEFVKKQRFSPDSFIQIAMQYAFYKMYNKPAAHYESAATRKYIGGRTETIRSCSTESVAFAKAMLDSKKSDADRVAALKAAIQSHKQYSVEAVNGYGVDRHFLGLKLAAKELGLDVPEIFKDPSFVRSTHMRISSSQVATKCDGFMCYGPTEADGYGCCYNPRPEDMNFAISAFVDCHDTSADKFRAVLESSLNDMHTLLAKTQKAKL